MRKVGIIGMGNVGSAVAHALIQEGAFDEYVFIDKREEKVRAEALDFEDAKANQTRTTTLRSTIMMPWMMQML